MRALIYFLVLLTFNLFTRLSRIMIRKLVDDAMMTILMGTRIDLFGIWIWEIVEDPCFFGVYFLEFLELLRKMIDRGTARDT